VAPATTASQLLQRSGLFSAELSAIALAQFVIHWRGRKDAGLCDRPNRRHRPHPVRKVQTAGPSCDPTVRRTLAGAWTNGGEARGQLVAEAIRDSGVRLHPEGQGVVELV